MDFEPKFQTVQSDKKVSIASSQCVVDCNLISQDGGISKILCFDAYAKVTNCETYLGEIKYDLSVDFCVVTLDENGMPNSLSYTEFVSDTIKNSKVSENAICSIKAQVLDMRMVSKASNKVVLECVIDLFASIIESNEITYLSPESIGICSMTETQEVNMLVANINEKMECGDRFEIKEDVDKVLCTQNQVILKNVSSGLDCIIINGEVICDVLFANFENPCNVFSKQFRIPFDKEFDAPGARVNQNVISNICIDNSSITVTVQEGLSIIDVNLELLANAWVCDKVSFDNISDVYSLDKEIELVSKKFDTLNLEDEFVSIEKLNGVLTVQPNQPAIDKLLTPACNQVAITNLTACDGYALCEGVVSSSIFYCSDETVCSSVVEIPFSVNLQNAFIDKDSILSGRAVLTDIMAKHKRTDTIDVYAELLIDVSISRKTEVCVISDIVATGDKVLPNSGISVYIAKGNESLFEVSKQLSAPIESIVAQNAETSFPLERGERIVFFRQRNCDFT